MKSHSSPSEVFLKLNKKKKLSHCYHSMCYLINFVKFLYRGCMVYLYAKLDLLCWWQQCHNSTFLDMYGE